MYQACLNMAIKYLLIESSCWLLFILICIVLVLLCALFTIVCNHRLLQLIEVLFCMFSLLIFFFNQIVSLICLCGNDGKFLYSNQKGRPNCMSFTSCKFTLWTRCLREASIVLQVHLLLNWIFHTQKNLFSHLLCIMKLYMLILKCSK